MVSIRYIAVLGFQQEIIGNGPANTRMFPSAISRYLVSNRYSQGHNAQRAQSFHPLYRGTWFPTCARTLSTRRISTVSIRYIAVLGFQPYLKNAPSDQRRRKRFTHPRRIDHIPTFASLNHDKNTRSTHYTPNAGIELSETTPPPLQVNPVQNHT